MSQPVEWRVDLYKDLAGEVTANLYEADRDGQWSHVASERFGPFDTAGGITDWVLRHWGPRARLPLR